MKKTGASPFPAVMLILVMALLLSAAPAQGLTGKKNTDDTPPAAELSAADGILIKLKSEARGKAKNNPHSTGIDSLDKLHKEFGVKNFRKIGKSGLAGWYKAELEEQDELKLHRLIARYKRDSNVEAAEPNYEVTVFATPNDPYYSSTGSWNQTYPDMYGIKKINPEAAWDITTGSIAFVVADIDTGVDRNHPDLATNMWVNEADPINGVDDDLNGYIDDYYGWDWVNNDNDPMDDHGHGTHTAGTIAAAGNNSLGVVGVNWQAKIMALKFLSSGGSGTLEDGAAAIEYAADMGARISSNSWGCNCQSQLISDAIKYAHDRGMAFVAAAGNSGIDAIGFSPAGDDYAITVAATDSNDAKAYFSNWGSKIDVAAPGVDILSTRAAVNPMCDASRTVGTNYCRVSGTSMATPHVAGLAALLLSANPTLTPEELRQLVRKGAADLGTAGRDSSFGYGRIDASSSLALPRPLAPVLTSPRSRSIVFGSIPVNGSAEGTGFAGYSVHIGEGRQPTGWTTIASSSTPVANGELASIDTLQLNDGKYSIMLNATDTSGASYQFQVYDVEIDNFDAAISSPAGLISPGLVTIYGSALAKNGLVFSYYTLEWGAGAAPSSYSAAGISLANNGTQPVANGALGTWNTSALAGGIYTLRLTVNAQNGAMSQYSVALTVDGDLVPGWPKVLQHGDGLDHSYITPAVADLDGDGMKEIIALAPEGKIHVFRKDGSDFPGFPVQMQPNLHFNMPVNVADLDNDGKLEIIAGASGPTFIFGNRSLLIYRYDGTPYPGWPLNQPRGVTIADYTPAIADLNYDGGKDIVLFDANGYLHAYQLDGSELPGFPKRQFTEPLIIVPTVSVADMQNDHTPEIAYAMNNKVYLFDNNGNLLPGWPFTASPNTTKFENTPTFGDVDGDGVLELGVFGVFSPNSSIHLLRRDGTVVTNWPQFTGPIAMDMPQLHVIAFADTNNDGADEIIATGNYPGLRVFSANGTIIMQEKTTKGYSTFYPSQVSPAVADVDGDGKPEFASLYSEAIQITDDDGWHYWERQIKYEGNFFFSSPPILADVDGNGRLEVIAARTPFSNVWNQTAGLYVWEIPSNNNLTRPDWPMFGHDAARSGRLTADIPDLIQPIAAITSPASSETVGGSVQVAVSASDNVGVFRVELYANGTFAGSDFTSPYTIIWTPASNGLHSLQAKAIDAAGNSGLSDAVQVNVQLDSIDPTVQITSPANGSTVSGLTTLTATAIDNIAVANVEFYVDGALLSSDSTSPYTASWQTTGYVHGSSHIISAKAYDSKGNIGTSNPVVAIVSDIVLPLVSITSPGSGSTVNRRSTITIAATASDISGISKVEFRVNGKLTCTDATASYTCAWTVPNKPGATYQLEAAAYDVAGNKATATITVTSV